MGQHYDIRSLCLPLPQCLMKRNESSDIQSNKKSKLHLKNIRSQIHLSGQSVTRFGEISPLFQNFIKLCQIVEGLFSA